MLRHEIADYLPLDARRAACAATYSRFQPDGTYPRTADGRCPLGVVLHRMGRNGFSPSAEDVAGYLCLTHHQCADVRGFMTLWDGGIITPADLPTILGVDDGD